MREERKEGEEWTEEWVNECTHSRSFLTSGVTPNPGSRVIESVMCVTSLCLCGTTQEWSLSMCQINNPRRIKHTLVYEHILLGWRFLMLIDSCIHVVLIMCLHILNLYSHTTLYLTLAAAVFEEAPYTSECTDTRWWYSSLLYAHHAVTRQPAFAAQHCGIPLGSVLRMSTLRCLWGTVYEERYIFKTHTNSIFSHNIPLDGSWCFSPPSCVWFMMSVWHSLWERMVFLLD